MTRQPENEPGIAPNTRPEKRAEKAKAGRGLAFFFIGALAFAFLMYLTIILYGTITAV